MSSSSLKEIEVIYLQRLDEFCSVVAAITRDRDGALDIVHEAFVSALRSQSRLHARRNLPAWLWRIVVNAAREHQRQARTVNLEWRDGDEAAGDVRLLEDLGPVAQAIRALPERQRLTVFLRYYADLDYRQIGMVLGVATGTVAATLNAAHRTLQFQLDEVAK